MNQSSIGATSDDAFTTTTQAPPPDVAPDAVIVTYNSGEDLRATLACAPLREAFGRIVVVDNNSRDDSVEVAEAAGLEVVRRSRNDSMAAAVNAGARRMRGDVFALLNPDVQLDSATAVTTLS